jgi:hypothetical protein
MQQRTMETMDGIHVIPRSIRPFLKCRTSDQDCVDKQLHESLYELHDLFDLFAGEELMTW